MNAAASKAKEILVIGSLPAWQERIGIACRQTQHLRITLVGGLPWTRVLFGFEEEPGPQVVIIDGHEFQELTRLLVSLKVAGHLAAPAIVILPEAWARLEHRLAALSGVQAVLVGEPEWATLAARIEAIPQVVKPVDPRDPRLHAALRRHRACLICDDATRLRRAIFPAFAARWEDFSIQYVAADLWQAFINWGQACPVGADPGVVVVDVDLSDNPRELLSRIRCWQLTGFYDPQITLVVLSPDKAMWATWCVEQGLTPVVGPLDTPIIWQPIVDGLARRLHDWCQAIQGGPSVNAEAHQLMEAR